LNAKYALLAVKMNGSALKHVANKTNRITMEAIMQNGNAFQYATEEQKNTRLILIACQECSSGKYNDQPGQHCQDCTFGKYNEQDGQSSESVACKNCPVGKYSTYGADSCKNGNGECAAGSYTLPDFSACVNCPVGTYQNQDDQSICTVCMNGTYSALWRASQQHLQSAHKPYRITTPVP